MAARPGMQTVELQEEPAVALERARTAPSDGPGSFGDVPTTAPAGRRRRWWLAAAGVAAVGLVVAQVAVGAHERRRDALAAAVPGAVARADSTLHPVWRMDDAQRRFVTSSVRFGDTAVGIVTAQDGSRTVHALDVATGENLWSYPVNGPDHQRAEGGDDVVQPGSCTAVAGGGPARVACYVTDGVSVQTGGELVLQLRPAKHGRIIVLDASGTAVVDRQTPLASAFAATGSLLVLGSSGANQHRVVEAEDLATGARRWSWQTPTATGDQVGLGQHLTFQLFALGSAVGVALPGGQVVVLGADGSVVHDAISRVYSWSPTGSTVVLGLSGVTTRLVRPGSPDVSLSGAPVRTAADDGSVPGLVLTSDGERLHAWDARTGATRWQARIAPQSRAVVLHGRVALLGGGALVVLDGRSGVTLAAVPPTAGATLAGPLSDGRHLLLAELGANDGSATITAYSSGGDRVWSTRLPPGTSALQQAGRQLLVYDDAGLEVLGTRE